MVSLYPMNLKLFVLLKILCYFGVTNIDIPFNLISLHPFKLNFNKQI